VGLLLVFNTLRSSISHCSRVTIDFQLSTTRLEVDRMEMALCSVHTAFIYHSSLVISEIQWKTGSCFVHYAAWHMEMTSPFDFF
jgi:hypothetical protein